MRIRWFKKVRGDLLKRIIIFTLIALLGVIIVFGTITGVSYFKDRSSGNNQDSGNFEDADYYNEGGDLFYAYTSEDVEALAKKYNLEIDSEESIVYLPDAKVNNITMLISYNMDDENNSTQMIAYMVPFIDDFEEKADGVASHTGSELKEKIKEIISCLEKITTVTINENFYIISDEKLLDNASETSYEKILSGEAVLHMSLRDNNGAYWCLYSTFYEDHVRFEILRCFDPEMYADSITNVTAD